jgi:hypothetical protein
MAAAPTILDQARKLVGAVRRKDPDPQSAAEPTTSPQGRTDAMSGIDVRLSQIEGRIEEIAGEAISSAELLKSLAEQNSQLVQALQILSVKMRRLAFVVFTLATVVCALVLWQLLS